MALAQPFALAQASDQEAAELNRQVVQLYQQGRYAQAAELAARALNISERTLGPEHPSTGSSLNNLAVLYKSMGQYAQALPLYQRALAIAEKAQGPDHPSTGTSLNNLAELYESMGQYAQALPLYLRALAVRERALGPEHPDTGASLNNLAGLYRAMGQHAQALPIYQRALGIAEKAEGPDHPSTGTSLNNLAELYRAMGQYAQALPMYQRALAITEKAQGPDHPSTGTRLNNLALLYRAMGQYAQALPLSLRALAISEKAQGPDHPSTGSRLNNLAGLYQAMGQYAQALPLYQRALEISEKAQGPDHPSTGSRLNNLALLYQAMGQYAKALPLSQRALAIAEKAQGPNHPSTGLSLNNLAALFESTDQDALAMSLYQRAIQLFTRHGSSPVELAQLQSNLALLHHRLGHTSQAIYHGKLSINGYQQLRGRFAQMDKALQQSFLKKHENNYQQLYGWLVDQGRLGEAEQVLAMLKADELDEFTQRSQRVDPSAVKAPYAGAEIALAQEEAQLAEEGRAIWQKLGPLDASWRQGRAKSPDFALPAEVEAERLQLTTALDRLNERYRTYNARLSKLLNEQKFDAEELQRLAGRSDEYRRILGQLQRSSGQQPVLLQYVMAPDKLYIQRHDSQRSQPISVAVSSKEINQQVHALRTALLNPSLDPRASAKALYDWLIAPVQAGLAAQGAQHLMISMTGALRYIPMAALYDGRRWLVQDYSLSMFSETVTDQLKDKPVDWRLAGFGLTRAVPNFSALPGVQEEFAGITRSGLTSQVSLDEAFTASRVRHSIEGGSSPVVHVASHFHLAPGTDAASFLVLGDGSTMPLQDIGALPFEGIDLLTLSACETGLGSAAGADGKEVESLGAMVQRKGAKAVMASLWKVVDQSTAQLMQGFYTQRVQGKQTKAQALRQAQLAMIGQEARPTSESPTDRGAARRDQGTVTPATDPALAGYRHPYYWAPFVLMGNWL